MKTLAKLVLQLKINWCFLFLLNFLEKSCNYILVTVPSVIAYCIYSDIPNHIIPALMTAFVIYTMHIFIGFGVKQFVLSLVLRFKNIVSSLIAIKE